MLSRKLLISLGVLALLAGTLLSVLWYFGAVSPPAPKVVEIPKQWILLAKRPIAAGSLLRPDDMAWGEVLANTVVAGSIVRGTATDAEFVGTVSRLDFAANAPLVTTALVRPGDPGFLVAALRPGFRAVSIAVDAAQSTSGLVLPGDRVDVVLTQTFSGPGTNVGEKSVGETVLRDLRVIAIDQTLTLPPKAVPGAPAAGGVPKTMTLEVTEQEAQELLVAEQLGKVQLTLRGREDKQREPFVIEGDIPPSWASDVSPALAGRTPGVSSGQGAIEVMRGSAIERRCPTAAGITTCP